MAPKQPKPTVVQRLERLIDSEEEEIKTERDPQRKKMRVNTLATLLRELRQAQKEERRGADDLDKARVLEWFLRQDQTEQGRFHRELGQRMKKGSGLA